MASSASRRGRVAGLSWVTDEWVTLPVFVAQDCMGGWCRRVAVLSWVADELVTLPACVAQDGKGGWCRSLRRPSLCSLQWESNASSHHRSFFWCRFWKSLHSSIWVVEDSDASHPKTPAKPYPTQSIQGGVARLEPWV